MPADPPPARGRAARNLRGNRCPAKGPTETTLRASTTEPVARTPLISAARAGVTAMSAVALLVKVQMMVLKGPSMPLYQAFIPPSAPPAG